MRRAPLLLLLMACGSKMPAPPAATANDAVTDFHELLAPLWHAEEGPQRVEDTCRAMPDMDARAKRLAAAKPGPQSAAVVDAVAALAADCNAGRGAFQERFTLVHEAFHAVAGH